MSTKKIEDRTPKKGLTRKNKSSDEYISDDSTHYGQYTDINNFNQIIIYIAKFSFQNRSKTLQVYFS